MEMEAGESQVAHQIGLETAFTALKSYWQGKILQKDELIAKLQADNERLRNDTRPVHLNDLQAPDAERTTSSATVQHHVPSMPTVAVTGSRPPPEDTGNTGDTATHQLINDANVALEQARNKISQLEQQILEIHTALVRATEARRQLKTLCKGWIARSQKFERQNARLIAERNARDEAELADAAVRGLPPTQFLDKIEDGVDDSDTMTEPPIMNDDFDDTHTFVHIDGVGDDPELDSQAITASNTATPDLAPNNDLTRQDITNVGRDQLPSSQTTGEPSESQHDSTASRYPSRADGHRYTRKRGFATFDADGGDGIKTEHEGTQHDPIMIKSEPRSSPPPATTRRGALHRTLTLDLDEAPGGGDTPRKRRRLEALLRHAKSFQTSAFSTLHCERSYSVPIEEDDEWNTADHCKIGYGAFDMPELHRANSDPVIKVEEDNGHLVDDQGLTFELEVARSPQQNNKRRPLQFIDVNDRHMSRAMDISARKPPRRRPSKHFDRLNRVVAEDGTAIRKRYNPTDAMPPPKRKEAEDRLSSLLTPTSRTTQKKVLSPRLKPSEGIKKLLPEVTANQMLSLKFPKKRRPASEHSVPKTPIAIDSRLPRTLQASTSFGTPTSAKAVLSDTTKTRVFKAGSAGRKGASPLYRLRETPISLLKLNDFKKNPRLDTDTFASGLRRHEERRQLPPCTDDNCAQGCGKALRALALELNPTVPRSLFDSSQEWNDMTDDERLMLWHLGETYNSEIFARLSPDKRDELVLKAKIALVAEKHGRHRVQPERQRSPPGFWRADMPSSQEIERDREKSKKAEREEVQERYREAMREGGLWVFKDE